MQSTEYNAAIFETQSREAAMRIILTPEVDQTTGQQLTTDERWSRETGWTADRILEKCDVATGDVLLDFGCGIGRLAKEILSKANVSVIGIDISPTMIRQAYEYVGHPRFSAMTRDVFIHLALSGKLCVDHAYSVYVLQHVQDPARDIHAIARATRVNFLLLNNNNRAVPVTNAANSVWSDDGFNVVGELGKHFPAVHPVELDHRYITALQVGLISSVFSKRGV
jgi:SAM-dependent methyltransferase